MRDNRTSSIGEHLARFQGKITTSNQELKPISKMCYNPFTKEIMWNEFKASFRPILGKEFKISDEVLENLKPLFLYFLKDQEFFNCKNLKKEISIPSFDKGLLIIGGFGVGKTAYFKIFEQMFRNTPLLKFKSYSSKSLVRDYESLTDTISKQDFFHKIERKIMFIDDLNAEKIANNYGSYDVIGEILAMRYEKGLLTYATFNHTSDNKCMVETLDSLGNRYGNRIYDRLFEMFNIIEFIGRSLRV